VQIEKYFLIPIIVQKCPVPWCRGITSPLQDKRLEVGEGQGFETLWDYPSGSFAFCASLLLLWRREGGQGVGKFL
jgi:hypothetical protein